MGRACFNPCVWYKLVVARGKIGGQLCSLLVLLALCLVGSTATASADRTKIEPPDVETGPANVLREHSVLLEAIIYPKGHEAFVWFQIGTTKDYGRITEPETDEGAGAYGPETGLMEFFCHFRPATTYHYRAVAKNRSGKAFGQDRTFRTRPSYSSRPCPFDPPASK
jgi:hypothetical protein